MKILIRTKPSIKENKFRRIVIIRKLASSKRSKERGKERKKLVDIGSRLKLLGLSTTPDSRVHQVGSLIFERDGKCRHTYNPEALEFIL